MPVPPPPPPPRVFPKPEEPKSTEIQKSTPEDLEKIIQRQFVIDETLKQVFYKANTYLTPQLQEGPKCGLVALSIASSLTKNIDVDKILEEARNKNFTKQGEIFDANYLANLAEECCAFKASVIEGGLHKHFCCIINNLLNKNLILIPYDADHNHSPCLKTGFKAHWAVITGIVIFKTNETSNIDITKECDIVSIDSFPKSCDCSKDFLNSDIKVCIDDVQVLLEKEKNENSNNNKNIFKGKCFLIGLQGKSKHMGLWDFDEMAKSNDNLFYFSPDREIDDYVLPEGGPEIGLKGKAIILRYVPHIEESTIL